MRQPYQISEQQENRRSRWYFGGLASASAACFTHPLDLLKVHLQTQQEKQLSIFRMIAKIYREEGILSFYNGISASLLRQLTYTTARFAIYEFGKTQINTDSFLSKGFLAVVAGIFGGFVGVPTDMVNVRMQNDLKLPLGQRRNYKHVIDGLLQVHQSEGFRRMFTGATMAVSRAILLTFGQFAVYEQAKSMLLVSPFFVDDVKTHLTASSIAAGVSTAITQPLDVIKTRSMNAKPGEYKSLWDIVLFTARLGPLGFFKGFLPALARLGPQTILMFLILEQLRMNLGYLPRQD